MSFIHHSLYCVPSMLFNNASMSFLCFILSCFDVQGIIEPAFSKPRTPSAPCFCIQVPTTHQQKSSPPLSNGMLPPTVKPGRGKYTTASSLLELIKDVEIAISSRKGRTGTAAGEVAFPKGKENLASVLKRYKRRLSSNKLVGNQEGTSSRKIPSSGSYNQQHFALTKSGFFGGCFIIYTVKQLIPRSRSALPPCIRFLAADFIFVCYKERIICNCGKNKVKNNQMENSSTLFLFCLDFVAYLASGQKAGRQLSFDPIVSLINFCINTEILLFESFRNEF